MKKIAIRSVIIWLLLLASTHLAYSQQYVDIEFIDFQISDTVTLGGTFTLTGTLKNNGNIPVPQNVEMHMEAGISFGGSGGPMPPYQKNLENNFNNDEIPPNGTYNFSREIWVDDQVFSAESDVIVVVWPRTPPTDSDTLNNIFTGEMYVKSVEIATQNKNLDYNPVVLKGEDLQYSLLMGLPVDQIVGFKYDNGWQQLPIQIDELDTIDILAPYGPYWNDVNPTATMPSGRNILFYTDENTYTGGDSDPNFDLDDELVFMYKDAGYKSTATDYPSGVIQSVGIEVYVSGNCGGDEKYIYLFQQDGTLQQDAGVSYVDYTLDISNNYPNNFNFLSGQEAEHGHIYADHYEWALHKTWNSDRLKIYGSGLSEGDLLDMHQTHAGYCQDTEEQFSRSFKCFISNKSGSVRAIRSYMGATVDKPYMQRTHFFYGQKQEIRTDLRMPNGIEEYLDLFNYDNSKNGMTYINNIDVSIANIDGVDNDPIVPVLYENTPLIWELMESTQHGSILNVHELFTSYDSLILQGYWNDNTIIPNTDDISSPDCRVVYGSSGAKLLMPDVCTDPFLCPDQYVQHRRHIVFENPGLTAENASSYACAVRQKFTTDLRIYTPCYQTPEVFVFLEGAFDTISTQMTTHLNDVEILPGQVSAAENIATPAGQPYSIFPWNYIGNEGNRFLSEPYNSDIVDWVLISFRTALDANSTVAQTAGLLYNDGRIEFLNECLLSDLDGNSFYIALEHRSHMGIITLTEVPIINRSLQHDFRIQNSHTAEGTRYGQKELLPGIWGMIAGDGLQTTLGNDINGDDKAYWSDNSGLFRVYIPVDYNMDGDITGADKILWLLNNGYTGALPK